MTILLDWKRTIDAPAPDSRQDVDRVACVTPRVFSEALNFDGKKEVGLLVPLGRFVRASYSEGVERLWGGVRPFSMASKSFFSTCSAERLSCSLCLFSMAKQCWSLHAQPFSDSASFQQCCSRRRRQSRYCQLSESAAAERDHAVHPSLPCPSNSTEFKRLSLE